MKKMILTTLVLMSASFPAYAQNDLALCKLRAQHMSAANVVYQPGVDVNGKAVVPADVGGAPSLVPDNIRIPMTVDLAKRLGTTVPGAELNADMGFVEISRDGQVTFNGQDLTTQADVTCGNERTPVAAPVTAGVSAPAPLNALNAAAEDVKVVVPTNAPTLPIASESVNTQPLPRPSVAPVTAPSTKAVSQPIMPRNNVPSNTVALPPQEKNTLGQLKIPQAQAPKPVVMPSIAGGAKADMNMNADDIVYGEGN